MKGKKIGTITLALTLIGLGIILLVNIYTPLDIFKTLRIMSAISIILIGVEFIFYDWVCKKLTPSTEVKISAASIILLIIIYGSSFVVTSIPIVVETGEGTYWFRDLFEERDVYEFTENYTENAEGLNKLIVDNNRGNIDIERSEVDDINIEANIKVTTYEDKDHAGTIASTLINVDRKPTKTLYLGTDNKTFNNRNTSVSVSFTIQVPKHLEVDLDNRYGDIFAENIDENVTIENKHGNVNVENSSGAVTIENSYGNIDVIHVKGATKIENKHGKINVRNVKSDLTIKNSYDSTYFSNISGNVGVKQNHGSVEGSQIGENLEVITDYCLVKIDDVGGKADIETSHESINAKNIYADGNIRNEYGDIILENISGNIDIHSKHSNIDIDNQDIVLKNVDINNSYGSITLNVPDKQEGNFDLTSEYGNINTAMDILISRNKDNQKDTVKYSIGNDSNDIIVVTTHGDIRIK